MSSEPRNVDDLLNAAKRVLALDAAHGLPHEDMSFDAYNEWVAALYALKEAVERIAPSGCGGGGA